MKEFLQTLLAFAVILTAGCGEQAQQSPAPSPAPAPAPKAADSSKPLPEDVAQAAWTGDVEAVKKALEGGQDIDARDSFGSTMLLLSCVVGKAEITKLALENGADLEIPNNEGNRPLFNAAFFCHADILKLLIEKGANVNAPDKQGATPLDIAASEWSAELEGIYRFIGGILKLDIDLERIKKDRGTIAKILAENGGKTADPKDK